MFEPFLGEKKIWGEKSTSALSLYPDPCSDFRLEPDLLKFNTTVSRKKGCILSCQVLF